MKLSWQSCQKINMKHFENKSLSILTEIVDGVLYTEEWKDIPEYENKYQVSSFGRIKTLKWYGGNQVKVMSQGTFGGGYKNVSLCKNGICKVFNVHRLVAQSFVKNPENKKTVNHIHYDVGDNRFHQLNWFTYQEQHQDSWRLRRREKTREVAKENYKYAIAATKKTVHQYSMNGEYIRSFDCLLDAANSVNRSKMIISESATGRKPSAGGFLWRYFKVDKL